MIIAKSKIKLINIALLCAVLLAGQFFVLAHSVEHNFHQAEASCDAFATAERSANAAFCDVQVNIFGDFSPFFLDNGEQVILLQVSLAHQARAPPYV